MPSEKPTEASVFNTARKLESSADREAYLTEACAGDAPLRERVDKLLSAFAAESQFLEQPAAEFEATILTDGSGGNLAAALDAGLAPAFSEGQTIVLGYGNHSVLKMLGQTLDNVPRVALRDSVEVGADPIVRPKSSEMPERCSDSRYQLQGEIARGGMGAILKGRDTDLGRDLAIKVLLDAHKDKPEVVQRFIEEAQIGGQLQHPGIAPVYELGQFADKRPFFAMKLVKGETLSKLLADRDEPAADRGKFLGIFEQVCQTMAYAHSRGVIHRDLKPANVMVGAFGEVQVMDWGLAKVLPTGGVADEKKSHTKHKDISIIQTMRNAVGSDSPGTFGTVGSQTQMGSVMGTPAYMPPEQALGEIDRMDERADVFGLGAILCEILTGKPPYVSVDGTQVFRMASRGKLGECFARLDVCDADVELIALTRHCLEVEPQDRPRHAGMLAERVTNYLESVATKLRVTETEAAVQAERLEQQQRAARKLQKSMVGVAVVAVIAGIACVAALVARNEAGKLSQIAAKEADNARKNEYQAKENEKLADQSRLETVKVLAVVESQKAEVESSLFKAKKAEEAARAAEEEGRKLLYTTDMRLAPFVWSDDRATAQQLRTLLAKHIPNNDITSKNDARPADEKPDLRGFEWHYYQHLLDSSAAVYSGRSTSVVAGTFTLNGQLVTLDQNGQVRRWELGLQEEVAGSRRDLPKGGSASIRVLSPDGRLAALADQNKVFIVDTSTGNEQARIDSAFSDYRGLIFTQDSQRLIIVDDKIRWCEAASGAVIATHNHSCGRGNLALSADGLTLAVVGNGGRGNLFSTFRLDATAKTVTPQVTEAGRGGPFKASAMSPDGRLLAVGYSLTAAVTVYDTVTGDQIAQNGSAHSSPVAAMSFSSDGLKLATADVEGTIKVWEDAATLTSKSAASLTLKGHEAAVTHVGFSLDGKQLVSTSADKTARVWDMDRTGAIRVLERSGQGCFQARFSSVAGLIAAADSTGVRLWDAATGNLVRVLSAGEKGRAYSVAFSPTDSRLLAVGYGGQADVSYVALWDIDSGMEVARLTGATDRPDFPELEDAGIVAALAFSPDGKYLVAGFGSPNVFKPTTIPNPLKVWEVAKRQLHRRLSGHTAFCVSLDFSKDGTRLASGSRDGTAIIWSTATWKAMQTLQNPAPDPTAGFGQPGKGIFDDVAFSPDGQTLAVAGFEGSVQLWDVASGTLLEMLKGHSSTVSAVAFSPDGRTLATGGSDQTVRLWNVATRRELMQLNSGNVELGTVESLVFSPDGQHLLAGCRGSTAFWSTVPVVWNDSKHVAKNLERLLQSHADFQSRIRMFSENLLLHEALKQLDKNDLQVSAALAAAQANWHASQQEWPDAVAAFDRLLSADPATPAGWLRPPGLLRVATALLNQNRPREAASLLAGGARRRTTDGLPDAKDRHSRSEQAEGVELTREKFVNDGATGGLLHSLRQALNERLAQDPRDPGLLELRAELAGQSSDIKSQLADYTLAIEVLSQNNTKLTADLQRLYSRRGQAHAALSQWPQAVDDYARGVTDASSDESLLSNQALAQAEALVPSGKWTVLKPVEAKSELGATLSILPDNSILASGANPRKDRYHVVVTVATDIDLAAVRLESLTHNTLPGNGPGRGPDPKGTFVQTSWTVIVTLPDGKESISLNFDDVWANREYNPFPTKPNGHWNIFGSQGLDCTAVWSMSKPVFLPSGSTLTFDMQCPDLAEKAENLGHFRLSMSDDPAAIDQERKSFAVAKLNDPWQKLAGVYRIRGDQNAIDQLVSQRPRLASLVGDLFIQDEDWHRAVEIYSRGITAATTDADLFSKRARAYESLSNWDAAKADWLRAATGNSNGANLLAEFARRLVVEDKVSLAKSQFEMAQALYEQLLGTDPDNDLVAQELAQMLLDRQELQNSVRWTVLKPTEMRSEGGATLTLLDDNSILANGKNPDRDVYTLVARPGLEHVAVIRLEVLPHASLPKNGPGRFPGNGNFYLNELRVFAGGTPVPLSAIFVDYDEFREAQKIIDGNVDGLAGWANAGRAGEKNTAIATIDLHRSPDDELRIELHSPSPTRFVQHNLGRFRLSITDDPAAIGNEEKRFAAVKIADPWEKLAAAYFLLDNQLALNRLLKDHPAAIVSVGELSALTEDWERAVGEFSKVITPETNDARLLAKRAEVYEKLKHWDLAVADYTAAINILLGRTTENAEADLQRLYRRRGTAYVALRQWPQADDDFAKGIVGDSSDEDLLKGLAQALAQSQVIVMLSSDQVVWRCQKDESHGIELVNGADDGNTELASVKGEECRSIQMNVNGHGYAYFAIDQGPKLSRGLQVQVEIDYLSSGTGNLRVQYDSQSGGTYAASLESVTLVRSTEWKTASFTLMDARFANSQNGSADFRFEVTTNDRFYFKRISAKHILPSGDVGDPWVQRFAALKIADPWEKLAAAYYVLGNQLALNRLLKDHPAAIVGVGELSALGQDWERAVGEFSKAITPETKDARLFAKRAEAYEKLKQWDLAVADWTRASQLQPDVAFERFKLIGAGSWGLQTFNGAAGSMKINDGELELNAIVTTGTDWHLQVCQGPLQLENGTEYVISFKMRSPDSCSVTLIGIIAQEDYHNIGLKETIVPPAQFKEYEFTFVAHDVVPGNNGINLTFGANQGSVMIREIVILKKRTDELAAEVGLGERYAFAQDWERAVGEFSKAITPETKDARLFAKRAEAYEKLKQWDLAVADWTRASQLQPDIAFHRFRSNGAAPWQVDLNNDGVGSVQDVAGTFVFTTKTATGTNWHVQAHQRQLQLENGSQYVIRFKMKSPDASRVTLFAGIDQEDWHSIGLEETFVPSSEFEDYEFKFVAHDVVPGNNRIGLQLGKDRGKVMMKDIVILKERDRAVDLLIKRASDYVVQENWELALAEWKGVVAQRPDQMQSAFDEFLKANRWNEAADFGLQLIKRKRTDSLEWLRIAPVLALAEDHAAYFEFCSRMTQQFAKSNGPEDFERVVKANLLRANSIDLAKLPVDKFAKLLDHGTVSDEFLPWGWATRALLAYRTGDAELTAMYVARSEERKPPERAHAMNLAVLAMAHHQLQHPEESRRVLEQASQLIDRLNADESKLDHDLLIAQILHREAEALINGKTNP